jgi:sulfur-oxidizing protein SoxY
MNQNRRIFLKGSLAGSAVAVALGAGLLVPGQVLAAWPKGAFEAKSVNDAMNGLVGTDLSEASSSIEIKAPDIAENGAVVPVTVTADIPNVESISVIAEGNGTPLAASFILAAAAQPNVSTRIKMGKTSNVLAVVKADGKIYSARKEVKVTIGGCGG